MSQTPRIVTSSRVASMFTAAAVLATTGIASADVSIKLEPGVAIPLSAPQSDSFDIGGGQALKAMFGITPYLDIGPSASFLFLPSATPLAESGVAWGFGGGLRIKRPHNSRTSGVSPWIDADLLYVRTGDLNRLGFDVAVGLAFPVDAARSFWVGPFVRYHQTLNSERAGYDTRDAKLLIAGLSVEFGSGVERKAAPPPPPVRVFEPAPPPPPPQVITETVVSCPIATSTRSPTTSTAAPTSPARSSTPAVLHRPRSR